MEEGKLFLLLGATVIIAFILSITFKGYHADITQQEMAKAGLVQRYDKEAGRTLWVRPDTTAEKTP